MSVLYKLATFSMYVFGISLVVTFVLFIMIIAVKLITGHYQLSNGSLVNIISFQEFIPLFTLIIAFGTIFVMYHISHSQIKTVLDENKKEREINRMIRIDEKVALLKAMRDELQMNYDFYTNSIKPNIEDYKQGNATHFFEYRTELFNANILNQTFEYNPLLGAKVAKLYAFLEMSNRIYDQARTVGLKKEVREDRYSQIFNDHLRNESAWRNIINELSQAANDYEAYSWLLEGKAISEGTVVSVSLNPLEQRMVLFNAGGESAQHLNLTIDFDKHGEENYTIEQPFLQKRLPVEFNLAKPRLENEEYTGSGKLTYDSRHSIGSKTVYFKVKWDPNKKLWEMIDQTQSFPLGRIFNENISLAHETEHEAQADIVYTIDALGNNIVLQNNGGADAFDLKIENEFGNVQNWKDYYGKSYLKHGESIEISLPKQSDDKEFSLAGKIRFKSFGKDLEYYKIFNIKWDCKKGKWVSD